MSRFLSFFVEGTPVAQPRQRHTKKGGNYIPRDHPIHAYKELVALRAKEAKEDNSLMTGPLHVDIQFVFPRPKSLSKKRHPGRVYYDCKPDGDNLQKAVFDALNGLAWEDDAQIVEGQFVKVYAAICEKPGVYIVIKELP